MNGPQDVGGKRGGLGPIGVGRDAPPFVADWERRVLGLSFCSWITSGVELDQSRALQAGMPYERYYGSSYYERWLYSLERLMVQKGIATEEEIASGAADPASAPTPPSARRSCGWTPAPGRSRTGVRARRSCRAMRRRAC